MGSDYFAEVYFKEIDRYKGGFDLNPINIIWIYLYKLLVEEQILKVREFLEDPSNPDRVSYIAYLILHRGGGNNINDVLDCFQESFAKAGVPIESIRAYQCDGGVEPHGEFDSKEASADDC